MFTYRQSTGRCFRGAFWASDKFEAVGYSGYSSQPTGKPILAGEGRNIAGMENRPDIGPIPKGCYTIGQPYTHPHLGPVTMDLTPDAGVNQYGRSLFRIHGDSLHATGTASHGGIVLSLKDRTFIAKAVKGQPTGAQDGVHVDNRLEVTE